MTKRLRCEIHRYAIGYTKKRERGREGWEEGKERETEKYDS